MIRVLVCKSDGGLEQGGGELLEREWPQGTLIWTDLEGFDPKHERYLKERGFHPLAIEDTFTLRHQPRVESYGDHLFVIVRGIDFNAQKDDATETLRTLKMAAFLSKDHLVTVHRAPLRSVEAVRRRVTESQRVPVGGLGQLLYMICDEMMDLFFPVVDAIGEEIEKLEVDVVEDARKEHLERVLALRRKLSTLRRSMLPHRQVFSHLGSSRNDYYDDNGALGFRDVLENVMRLADVIDQQRDLLVNVKDTYLSVISQKTNDVMRVLTVFSAIVLPLSLIAGVYGMNFENMPELHSKWGYFVVIGAMVAIAGSMIAWFRRRDWL
ncbi:MAG: magnesium/cobalt transporter CorA [Holophagales bacterium]|nr:magnesium/cobalt transporter CorA [Holophagales bacterium]